MKINHKHLLKESAKFYAHVIDLLDERGRKFGNINHAAYHRNGINVKVARVNGGRTDKDTHADLAAYAFLHWYTSGRHE
jgi:hypothetical protein